jgi:hypothetical protein
MIYEIQGVIMNIGDTVPVNERMNKRDLIVDCGTESRGQYYKNVLRFQLLNDRCVLGDRFTIGTRVIVKFGVSGSEWQKEGVTSYFINLNVADITASPLT